jgi:sortase A
MKLRISWRMPPLTRDNPWIRWSRRFFYVAGILALGYVGFVLLDAQLFQADQSRRFQKELNGLQHPIDGDERLHGSSIPPASAKESLANVESIDIAGIRRTPLGRIDISAIGLTSMILEGTDAKTLRRAVGHIPGTPLPGQRGNVAITGHRDTFFRPLRNIRKDDEIRLTTLSGSYRYWVDSIEVVEPDDAKVLDNSDDAILTLVTCYPFYFVGPAPKRFIVRAHRAPG